MSSFFIWSKRYKLLPFCDDKNNVRFSLSMLHASIFSRLSFQRNGQTISFVLKTSIFVLKSSMSIHNNKPIHKTDKAMTRIAFSTYFMTKYNPKKQTIPIDVSRNDFISLFSATKHLHFLRFLYTRKWNAISKNNAQKT